MANKQTIPGINTNVNRNLISGQMQAANLQSAWRVPEISDTLSKATNLATHYYEAEKDAAFKRFDLEADKLQQQELEEIRVAKSNEQIPEIENNFKTKLNEAFGQDKWGQKWLNERRDLYLAANSRDVMRLQQTKQHELYTLQLNQTLNTWADNISTSSVDKAKILMGDMTRYIDDSQLLSPTEKQNTKDKAINLVLERMASANPEVAISILKDKEFSKGLNVNSSEKINNLIKKQFAEMKFQEQLKIFNNERELSDQLDNMQTDEALRFLEKNEANVSKAFFKAKENALLSEKGITAETRADTAADFMMRIAALPKETDKIEQYYQETSSILADLENEYAAGNLTTKDKNILRANIYKREGANLETLKSNDDGTFLGLFGYSYKDAADDITNSYTGSDGNKIMLEYFRKINDGGEYNTDQKKTILQSLINKAKAKDLSLPYFINETEAKEAYEQGKIKKGDSFYINGRKAHI